MKKYVLVIIWPEGDELTATQPTTKRRKLQKCAASLNSSWIDGTRAEIRETLSK
jgi:hypothetical protein